MAEPASCAWLGFSLALRGTQHPPKVIRPELMLASLLNVPL